MCRLFFWSYLDQKRKLVFFSWDKICKPKVEGALNVKEILSWNRTPTCRWIHKILAQGGIWAHWCLKYPLRDTNIWLVDAKETNSWAWNNLISMSDLIVRRSGSLVNVITQFAN